MREKNTVFIHEVNRPQSVTLLRTGEDLAFEFRDGSLRVVVPKTMRTDLPDMVKIIFKTEHK